MGSLELKFHLCNICTEMISVLVYAVIFIFSSLDLTSADREGNYLGNCACQNTSEHVRQNRGLRSASLVNITTNEQEDEIYTGEILTPYSILSWSAFVCNLMPKEDACEKYRAFDTDRIIKGESIKVPIKLKLPDGTLLNKDHIEEIIIPQNYVHTLPAPPDAEVIEIKFDIAILKMKQKMYEGIGKIDSSGNMILQPICYPKRSDSQIPVIRTADKYVERYVFDGKQCVGHEAPINSTGRKISTHLRVEALVKNLIKEKKVLMVSKKYCIYCRWAKMILDKYNIKPEVYRILEIGNRSDAYEIMDYMQQLTGARSVPRIFIGGQFVGGCSYIMKLHARGELLNLLQKAGALQ